MLSDLVSLPSPTGIRRAGWGASPCWGRYYRPDGNAPKVAFIATHPNLDFSQHYLGELLAARGFGFLGWNTKFCGDESHFLLDHAIADIGAGVRWLRESAKADCVVILGNSGGGSLMAAYQSQTAGITIQPALGLRLTPGLDDLVPGDLYVALAAHPGRATLFASTMDPSVTDETDPISVDSSLDMYAEDNAPPFTAEFVVRYREAQLARNRRISEWALRELQRLQESSTPASDRLFVTYRLWADLRFLDPSIDPNDRNTPECWSGDPLKANYRPFGIGTVSTLRTWLQLWSIDGSQCEAKDHLPRIGVPGLVINAAADAGIFPSDAKTLYDLLGTQDKELVQLPGDHYFQRFDGARDRVADTIADWVSPRA